MANSSQSMESTNQGTTNYLSKEFENHKDLLSKNNDRKIQEVLENTNIQEPKISFQKKLAQSGKTLPEIRKELNKNNSNYYEEITLVNCKLNEIPNEMLYFENQTRLSVQNNLLHSTGSKDIWNVLKMIGKNLIYQDLSRNFQSSIDEKIFGQLNKLETLILSNNMIKEIPPTIKNMKSLLVLMINSNAFSNLPIEIAQLTNLSMQKLDWCQYLNPVHDLYIYKGLNIENRSKNLDKSKNSQGNSLKHNISLEQLSLELLRQQSRTYPIEKFISKFSKEKQDCTKAEVQFMLTNSLRNEDIGMMNFVRFFLVDKSWAMHSATKHLIDLAIKEEKSKSAVEIQRWQLNNAEIEQKEKTSQISKFISKSAYHKNNYLVERMISENFDPNYQDTDGYTQLFHIFKMYYQDPDRLIRICKRLFNKGLNPNAMNKHGWTALHSAVMENNILIIIFCLYWNKDQDASFPKAWKFNFSLPDNVGNNVAHFACKRPVLNVMTCLIKSEPALFIKMNNHLKLPHDLIPPEFQTTKKLSIGQKKTLLAIKFGFSDKKDKIMGSSRTLISLKMFEDDFKLGNDSIYNDSIVKIDNSQRKHRDIMKPYDINLKSKGSDKNTMGESSISYFDELTTGINSTMPNMSLKLFKPMVKRKSSNKTLESYERLMSKDFALILKNSWEFRSSRIWEWLTQNECFLNFYSEGEENFKEMCYLTYVQRKIYLIRKIMWQQKNSNKLEYRFHEDVNSFEVDKKNEWGFQVDRLKSEISIINKRSSDNTQFKSCMMKILTEAYCCFKQTYNAKFHSLSRLDSNEKLIQYDLL